MLIAPVPPSQRSLVRLEGFYRDPRNIPMSVAVSSSFVVAAIPQRSETNIMPSMPSPLDEPSWCNKSTVPVTILYSQAHDVPTSQSATGHDPQYKATDIVTNRDCRSAAKTEQHSTTNRDGNNLSSSIMHRVDSVEKDPTNALLNSGTSPNMNLYCFPHSDSVGSSFERNPTNQAVKVPADADPTMINPASESIQTVIVSISVKVMMPIDQAESFPVIATDATTQVLTSESVPTPVFTMVTPIKEPTINIGPTIRAFHASSVAENAIQDSAPTTTVGDVPTNQTEYASANAVNAAG
jgi:hypothetical protein